MRFIREFWVGFFAAAIGAAAGLASAALLRQQGDPIPLLGTAAVTALLGFLLGATSVEIWQRGPRAWARQLLGIDLRSLAVIRIGLALALLIDLAMRARDLVAHYSDAGILPLEIRFYQPSDLSLHLLDGRASIQTLLFLTAVPFALLLLLGYRTRLATIVSWFMLISLQSRNPLVLTGGDTLLRMMLFWGMFLPWGARYSVDGALNVSLAKRRNLFCDLGTVAVLVQIACMYGFSGQLKTAAEWRVDGTAVYYALSLDMLTTSFGQFLLNFPQLLKATTYSVWYLEVFAPLLIFWPWRNEVVRIALFVVLLGMHFGFQLCMWIGIFPFAAMIAVFALLPSCIWDWLARHTKSTAQRDVTIYYDRGSPFCRRAVLLLRTFLLIPAVRIRRLQAHAASGSAAPRNASWLVVDGQQTEQGFAGLVTLVRHSRLFRLLASILAWRPLAAAGERCYNEAVRRRKLLDNLSCCLRLHRTRIRLFWPIQPLLIVLIAYVLLFNFISIRPRQMSWFNRNKPSVVSIFGKSVKIDPTTIYQAGQQLRLDQNWTLFAPYPLKRDGWFVARGTMASGRTVDVLTGRAPTFAKPESVADSYINNRWRKYLEQASTPGKNPRWQFEFGMYLRRQWNAGRDAAEQVRWIDLYFVEELSRPPQQKMRHRPVYLARCPPPK